MGRTLDFITQRLAAAFPDADLDDTQVQQEFFAPLRDYLGEDFPSLDMQALLRAALSEQFPAWDGSVVTDLVARIAALLSEPLRLEINASVSRRKLNDARLLTGTDLEDLRSSFFVEPYGGQYAQGTFRAFFATARAVTLDPVTRITLPASSQAPTRTYSPTRLYTMTAAAMRQQVEAGRFYLDFDARATNPGIDHNLPLGTRAFSGIDGATQIVNITQVTGGQDADDPAAYLARISASNRLRSGSTAGGLDYLLRSQGLTDFVIVQYGDPRMVRDRVYGPVRIGGIPGGFAKDYSVSNPAMTGAVSLGMAYDVWVNSGRVTRSASTRVKNLYDEGVVLLTGSAGSFAHDAGVPVAVHPVTGDPLVSNVTLTEVVVVSRDRAFGLHVADPSLYRSPAYLHTWSAFPAQSGDILEREGWLDPFTGLRTGLSLSSLGTGLLTYGSKTIVQVPAARVASIAQGLWRFRIMRRSLPWWDADRLRQVASLLTHTCAPALAFAWETRRARSVAGTLLRSGVYPAVVVPGTQSPEVRALGYYPQTTNLLEDSQPSNVTWLVRAELMDPLTEQPFPAGTRAYLYPSTPLVAEFREPRHGLAATKGSTPVRVRFHLHGPQAMAPSPVMTLGVAGLDPQTSPDPLPEGYDDAGSLASYDAPIEGNPTVGQDAFRRFGPYRPLHWPLMTYTSSPLDAGAAEGDRLVLQRLGADPDLENVTLLDTNNQVVYDTDGPRLIRPGDWVLMRPTSGAYAFEDVASTDPAGWPDPYVAPPDSSDIQAGDFWQVCRAFPIVAVVDSESLTIAAPDIPNGETGDLWIVQGTSRTAQLLAGRGEEGTYFFDVFFGRWTSDADPQDVEHPPLGTLAQFDIRELYAQGFELCSATPGRAFSSLDDVSVVLHTSYANDGQELSGRAIQVYGPPGSQIEELQDLLSSDDTRPMMGDPLVKRMPPAMLQMALYFDAVNLTAPQALELLVTQIELARSNRRLEVSDLVSALSQAGADYVSTSRLLVCVQDTLRRHSYHLTRAAVALPEVSDLVAEALVVRRLDSTARAAALRAGIDFQDSDPASWIEEAIYRFGDFTED